jgi:hypothetical protein
MRDRAVYLCEVTYAKQPRALASRLHSWKQHWDLINQTLKEDTCLGQEWPLIPWVFAPPRTLKVIEPELRELFPEARTTNLESVLPWLYCTCDRKPEARDEPTETRPLPSNT